VPLAVKYYVIIEFRVQILAESSTSATYSFRFSRIWLILYHFDWQDTRTLPKINKPQMFRLMSFSWWL